MNLRTHLAPLLAGINLLLVALLAYLWVGPDLSIGDLRWRAPPALAPDSASLSVLAPELPAAGAGQYTALLERPLFSLDRRPPPAEAELAADVPASLADLRILGLLDGAGGYQAIIASVSGVAHRIAVGGKVGEWTLKAVEGAEAVFTNAAGASRRIAIERPGKPAGEAVPAGGDSAGASAAPARAPRASALSLEERARERLARRNALRQQHGLPPISQ